MVRKCASLRLGSILMQFRHLLHKDEYTLRSPTCDPVGTQERAGLKPVESRANSRDDFLLSKPSDQSLSSPSSVFPHHLVSVRFRPNSKSVFVMDPANARMNASARTYVVVCWMERLDARFQSRPVSHGRWSRIHWLSHLWHIWSAVLTIQPVASVMRQSQLAVTVKLTPRSITSRAGLGASTGAKLLRAVSPEKLFLLLFINIIIQSNSLRQTALCLSLQLCVFQLRLRPNI